MTRRKGEMTRSRLNREFPHHVALAADKVRGLEVSATVRKAAGNLGAHALTYHETRGDNLDFVIFCFADAHNAEVFARVFGGELLKP